MIERGSVLTLDVEKPAAGGRMLARHHGQVVLVWGAIPGERVTAKVELTKKSVAFATTMDVLSASADRRNAAGDWRCGGNVLAHVTYERQCRIKGEIIRDAFGRIGRVPLERAPEVIPSPERGYRMRARLHVQASRLGFYREESHELCDATRTGQLLESTSRWIAGAEDVLRAGALTGLSAVEISENIAGDQRACHLDLREGVDPSRYAGLAAGLTGLSAQRADSPDAEALAGNPRVADDVPIPGAPGPLRLTRSVRAFFQGNRFLVQPLLERVLACVSREPIADLYSGGGLFGLACLARGAEDVTLVEGDPVSGADLQDNAGPYRPQAGVERTSVELFLATRRSHKPATMIVDPPRTGLSREAAAGIISMKPADLVYVSCDVATLARDARALLDAGYSLRSIVGLDLFPNTAHVEMVTHFSLA
jgi:23S rRNA (uracil1939-C5)-methyltransferase